MESFLKDGSLSPSKQVKSKRKIHHQHQHQHQVAAARLPDIISRQTSCSSVMNQKFAPPPHHVQMEMVQLAALAAGGVFLNHRYPQQFSHSSSLPPLLPTYYQHHYHHHHQQQQPPLLPLPVVSKPITFCSLPPPSLPRSQSLASPIPRKQPNKAKASKKTATATGTATTAATATTATATATAKKKPTQNMKKENKELVVEESSEETKKKVNNEDDEDEDQVVWPAKGAGPDPGSLPKEFMTRVLLAADLNKKEEAANRETDNKSASTAASASVFNLISPPPSSLPLPKFTIMRRQSKLSCNAEAAAAEVDTGATDNLCRLLKLR